MIKQNALLVLVLLNVLSLALLGVPNVLFIDVIPLMMGIILIDMDKWNVINMTKNCFLKFKIFYFYKLVLVALHVQDLKLVLSLV